MEIQDGECLVVENKYARRVSMEVGPLSLYILGNVRHIMWHQYII